MSAEHLAGPYREPVKHPPPEGDRRAQRAIEFELEEGERLLWAGQPPQGVRFSLFDIFLIPFSLVWGGFAIAWEVIAIASDAPFFFPLFGVPFVAVGLYLMVGRFFFDSRARARTFYGVTDRRALVVTNTPVRKVDAVDLGSERPISLMEHRKGSGTIVFGGPELTPGPMGNLALSMSSKETQQFEKIQDARAVYQMLNDARDDLRERRRIADEPRGADASALAQEEERNEDESRMDSVSRAVL